MSKIAVLMSTYNGEKYLQQQIDSIIGQTVFQYITLYIRDDGSIDKTKEILETYAAKYPDKIVVFFSDNKGLNASFFWLIKSVRNFDYYCIADQDDVWKDDKIQTAVESLAKENNVLPLLYASSSFLVRDDLVTFGETRKKIRDVTIYNSLIQNFAPGHTQVFNNALKDLLTADLDTENIYVYDSWILNVAILYGKLVFDNESHTLYRQHENNQLGSGDTGFQKLLKSGKRIKNGHGKLYKRQIAYFNYMNSRMMREIGAYEYVNRFVSSKNFFTRLFFCIKPRFYRQKRIETIAFYLAYLFGKY